MGRLVIYLGLPVAFLGVGLIAEVSVRVYRRVRYGRAFWDYG